MLILTFALENVEMDEVFTRSKPAAALFSH